MKFLLLFTSVFLAASCAFAYSSGYGSAASAARSYYSSHSYYNSSARTGVSSYSSYSNYNSPSPSINSTYTRSKIGNRGNYHYRPASLNPSAYSTSAKVRNITTDSGITVVPFRYNTLNYTRIRNMEADPPKKYSAKCSDMGDASFCQ